jgi:hypothetical protein
MKTHPVGFGRSLNAAMLKFRRLGKVMLLAAAGVLLMQSARATLYLSEPFDYAPGSLTNNAAPWSTNGTPIEANPTLLLISGDLFYPPLTDPAPTNHARLQFSSNVKGIRQIPGGPIGDPVNGGSVYCSFIYYQATTNGTTANTPIVGLNVNATETINQAAVNGPVVYYQQSGGVGFYHLGIKVGGGTTGMVYPPGTTVYATGNTNAGTFGQTNLVVLKYTFNPGPANDTVALWINPDPGSFGLTEPAATTNDVAQTTTAGTDASAGLDYFQVRAGSGGNAAGTCQIDDVRIGTTWADVTPTCMAAGVSNPANEATSPGQTATFSVIGSGTSPTYQWLTNNGLSGWVPIAGATSSNYTTRPEVLADNGLQFECAVSVACDNTTTNSAPATLTVQTCVAAAVTNPGDQTVAPTQTATFTVTPTGTSPMLQWQTNNGSVTANITGATNASYTTPPEVLANDGLQYQCEVQVACGGGSSATSSPATLHVICTGAGTSNPTNQSIIAGQTATFVVTGSGSLPTYQWQNNSSGSFANIPGATNAVYTTPPAPITLNNVQYQCIVSVACNSSSATSAPATLSVTCNTASTTDPANVAIGAGQTASFAVVSTSSNPTYQWQTNNGGGWVAITGATNASYTTPAETLAANGLQFRCMVSAACDSSSVVSAAATLSVYPATAEFMSVTTGNISDPNTWEESFDNGATWVNPAYYAPTDVNSTNVTVQTGHIVFNDINNQLDQVMVQTGGQISVNKATTLTIASGKSAAGNSLDINGVLDVTGTLVINSNATVVVESGGAVQTEQGGVETINGTLTFTSNSIYYHLYSTTAGTIPTATWNAGSTCEIIGFSTSTATVSGATQNFYNFLWNCPNESAAVPFGGNVPTAVNGAFTVANTGSSEIRLANNNSPVLNLLGDLDLSGGTLTLASGNGKPKLNLSGDFNLTGGNLNQSTNGSTNFAVITFVKAGTQTFNDASGNITGPINWFVTNGSTVRCLGTLTSNLTLDTGGKIELSIASEFVVTGSLTNNNNTVVVDAGGGALPVGNTYPLLNYEGNISGALNSTASIINGSVAGDGVIDTASTPHHVNLVITPHHPHIVSVGLAGTTLTISGTNGTAGATYGVLASTNLFLPVAQWTPILKNASFNGSGNFTANIPLSSTIDPNAPQQYFRIETPSP